MIYIRVECWEVVSMSINPKAQKEFEKAEKFREQYLQALHSGKSLFLDHYHSQAIKHYETAGRYDHPGAQYRLAIYYSHNGSLSENVLNFKDAYSLNFTHQVLPWLEDAARNGEFCALKDYTKYLIDGDEKKQAMQLLEKAVKREYQGAWILLADVYHDQHFYQKEFEVFRDHEPTNLADWLEWPYAFRMSLLHFDYGERSKGINCLRRLSENGDYRASVRLSTILEEDGQQEKAIEVYINVAVCEREMDEVDQYVTKAREAISKHAKSSPTINEHLLKACMQTLLKTKDVDVNDLNLAQQITSKINLRNAWMAGRLGIYYVGIKGFEEVGFQILSIADGRCLDPEVATILGDCYYEGIGTIKNTDLAIPLYERYHKIEGEKLKCDASIEENHQRFLRIADYYYGKAQYKKSLTIYHHYDSKNLLTSKEYDCLVYIYRYVNLGLSSEAIYHKVVEYANKSGSAFGKNQIGLCYLDGYGIKKDASVALKYLLEADRQLPGSAYYMSPICKAYLALDDLDQALVWAKKVEKVKTADGHKLLTEINAKIKIRDAKKFEKEMKELLPRATAYEKEGKISEAFDLYLRIGVTEYDQVNHHEVIDEARNRLMHLRKGNETLNRLLLTTCLRTILKDEQADLTFVSNVSKVLNLLTQKNAWLACRLGVHYKNTGLDNDHSIKLLQASFKHKADPEVAMVLGDYYHAQKQYDEALAYYETYHTMEFGIFWLNLDVDPDYNRLETIAGIYYNQNKYQEAFDRYNSLHHENKLKKSGSYDVLGYLYYTGKGVKKDLDQAYLCFKVSNSAYGKNMTGVCLLQGLGTKKNVDEALKRFMEAESISSMGLYQYNIGCCYEEKKEYDKAMEWFKKAQANKYAGATKAISNLEIKMASGQVNIDIEKIYKEAKDFEMIHMNPELAFHKYKEIASLTSSSHQDYITQARAAIHRLNGSYSHLNPTIFNYYFEVAFKGNRYKFNEIPSHVNDIDSNTAWAAEKLGICFLDGVGVLKDDKAGFSILQRVCQLTVSYEAQTRLGDCYYNGVGTKMNYGKAKEFFEKNTYFRNGKFEYRAYLPENLKRPVGVAWCNYKLENYAVAVLQFEVLMKTTANPLPWLTENLGWCYYYGKGTTVNKTRSFELFKMQKTAYSLNMLGLHYYNGEGCLRDYRLAYECFVASEKLDPQPYVQFNIGLCYEFGYYVSKNTQTAIYWYEKAAKQNYQGAKDRLKLLRGY